MTLFTCTQKTIQFIGTISLVIVCLVPVVCAEVVLDGTVGPKGSVSGPSYVITDKMGSQAGSNLFHSFQTFNINTGESGTFTGPNSVQNVIGRVTGGTSSMIDGRLGCSIPGANLFLINPYGMMFGPSATLDVNGSFHASTADYLLLGDSGRFDAIHLEQSVLTVDPPSTFGFLDDQVAPITLDGSYLKVPEGGTISLVGGNISMSSSELISESGNVNLVSVASKGEALLDDNKQIRDVSSFSRFGDIEMSDDALIQTDGPGGNSVFVRGGRFVIDNSTISAKTQWNGQGDIVDIALEDDLTITNLGLITTKVELAEKGADIKVDVNNLYLENGGIIAANTAYGGDGGNVDIHAKNSVEISGVNGWYMSGFSLQSSYSTGKAGQLSINTPDLTIKDGGHIFGCADGSYEGRGADIRVNVERLDISNGGGITGGNLGGKGDGGSILINASEAVSISGTMGSIRSAVSAETLGEGDGGSIEINTPRLTLTDGAAISGITTDSGKGGDIDIHAGVIEIMGGGYISAKTKGDGQGGNVNLTASNSVTISGSKDGKVSAVDISNEGSGNGGHLEISTADLRINDTGTIRGVSDGEGTGASMDLKIARLTIRGGGDINCSAISGKGGNLNIKAADSVSISGEGGGYTSGIYANAFDNNAGSINISTRSLNISDSGNINSESFEGHGADITVNADNVSLTGESQITVESKGTGQGGNITVSATGSVYIEGDGPFSQSGIFSSTSGKSKGGDITVAAESLTVKNHGAINSSSTGDGSGGSIDVQVRRLEIKDGGTINSSGLVKGKGGEISITANGSTSISHAKRTHGFSGVFSIGYGEGAAGTISLTTSDLSLSGEKSQISTSTDGSGNGGEIQIHARDIRLTENSVIKAESTGSGNAGSINITCGNRLALENARIETDAEKALGGNINITGKDIRLTHNSAINTSVASGEGKGGNVTIDAATYVALENSDLTANADQGYGGDITINADAVFLSPDSDITASSQVHGKEGKIIVNSPVQDIVNAMVPLRESFLSADELLPERCETRDPEQAGSFIVDSDEGLPPRPDELLW